MKILCIVLIVVMCGCKSVSTVKEIKITYINSLIDTHYSLGCWDIFSIDSIFLSQVTITDSKITEPIYNIVKNLEPDTSCINIDVRTTCLLRYNTSRIADTLCLGEKRGIILNGKNVCDNENLFKLIREQLQIVLPEDFTR